MEVDQTLVGGTKMNGIGANGDSEQSEPQELFNFGDMADVEELEAIESRPKHKAKRRVRLSSKSEDPAPGPDPGSPLSPTKLLKNQVKDRHSRTGRRGEPKKGGAGGRYTWGKLGEIYDDDGRAKDSKDPNYDSAEETDMYRVTVSKVELTPEEFSKIAYGLIKDYFEHGDGKEVLAALNEYNVKEARFEVVRVLITLALEKKPAYREMSSRLLSMMHGHYVNSRDVTNAFDALLGDLEDLSLDTPDAAEVVGTFLARAVADDCVPPLYLGKNPLPNELAKSVFKRANLLVNMKHGMARLDSVWGVGGGQWPVKTLVRQMNLLLDEFISSADVKEACRCLSDLDVPHFHHELVYEAVVLAIERNNADTLELIVTLLSQVYQAGIVTKDQMQQGLQRVYDDIGDICLDVPNAYTALGQIVSKGEKAAFVPKHLAADVPQRGRKRFVSQGDGGAVKQPED